MTSIRSKTEAGNKVPISLEGERRKGMKLLYEVEKSVKTFYNRWFADSGDDDVDEWMEFVNMAKSKYGTHYVFKNCKAFAKELHKLKNEGSYLAERTDTVDQLTFVVDRARHFDDLFESAYQRLEDATELYLSKYCLSFFPEMDDLDIECVRQYENSINNWQQEIRKHLDDALRAKEGIVELAGNNFMDYLQYNGQILNYMTLSFDSFTNIGEPMRSWVTADEGYTKRLSMEITTLKSRRTLIAERLRRNHHNILEAKSKVNRSSFANKKLKEKLQGKLQDRKFCRRREFSFVDKIEINENILAERKMELDDVLEMLERKPIHSLVRRVPSSDGLKEKGARLQEEVTRLERQVKRMRKGKRDMRETRYQVQKEVHTLSDDYEVNVKQTKRQTMGTVHQEDDVRSMQEELKMIDSRIDVLRRIIAIKTHPSTVKRIYFHGYTPGERIDFRGSLSTEPDDPPDTLREAMGLAATGVGRDFDKMYQRLPFLPPRTPMTRSTDLDVIDMCYKGVNPPSEDLALRSLEKWTSLSRMTSVNALVRTLRSIKKSEVAKKIEKKVLTVVN